MNTPLDSTNLSETQAKIIDVLARNLDRNADFSLQHGRVLAAERLSKLAADLREGSAQ